MAPPSMRPLWRVMLLLALTFPAFRAGAFAQWQRARENALFLELGGSGGLGSLNFEQAFLRSPQMRFAWRAGFSLAPIDRNNGTGIVVPLMLHCTLGPGAHTLDLGLGHGFTLTTKGHWFVLGAAAAGYRFQPAGKRIFLRLSYTPLISYLLDFQWQHWAGASIGFNINKQVP